MDIIAPCGTSWYCITNYAIESGLISLEVGRGSWSGAGAVSLHLKSTEPNNISPTELPTFLLSLSLKDMISSKYRGSEPWHLFFTAYSLMLFSSPVADELWSLTHSASAVLLPLTLFLPSFKPSLLSIRTMGHWQVFYLTSLFFKPSYLNRLNKPIYSDCWLIFLKHTSDDVLGYLKSFKDSYLIPSLATGEESYRRGEPGGGSQVSPEATGNLLPGGPWENSLFVRAGREAGRLPEPSTHFHRMKMKNELEKFCPVHLLSKETKP